jgi:hypothetical protein
MLKALVKRALIVVLLLEPLLVVGWELGLLGYWVGGSVWALEVAPSSDTSQ